MLNVESLKVAEVAGNTSQTYLGVPLLFCRVSLGKFLENVTCVANLLLNY